MLLDRKHILSWQHALFHKYVMENTPVQNTDGIRWNGLSCWFVDDDDFHLCRHWNGYLCHSFEAWWSFLGANHRLHLSYRWWPLYDGKFGLICFISGTAICLVLGCGRGFVCVCIFLFLLYPNHSHLTTDLTPAIQSFDLFPSHAWYCTWAVRQKSLCCFCAGTPAVY